MPHPSFAQLPSPPYYAVIFSSLRTDTGADEYAHMAERMVELAQHQPGYLGAESTRGTDGFGITVSYWSSLDAIAHWRAHAEHRVAQETGKAQWYEHYELRVALVEKAYGKRP
jgi:heme-degrading monooxygenase HmoA